VRDSIADLFQIRPIEKARTSETPWLQLVGIVFEHEKTTPLLLSEEKRLREYPRRTG
jgi:hypothetical protein